MTNAVLIGCGPACLCALSIRLTSVFAHRIATHLDAMGVVHQAVACGYYSREAERVSGVRLKLFGLIPEMRSRSPGFPSIIDSLRTDAL